MRSRRSSIDCTTGDITQGGRSLANGQAAPSLIWAMTPTVNLKRMTGPVNVNGQRYTLDQANMCFPHICVYNVPVQHFLPNKE